MKAETETSPLNIDQLSSEDFYIVLNDNLQHKQLIGIGVEAEFIGKGSDFLLDNFQKFLDRHNDWKFGYISYDLKNNIEKLSSKNIDTISAPLIHFIVPKQVWQQENNTLTCLKGNGILPLTGIKNNEEIPQIQFKSRISKTDYINSVSKLQKNIQLGDIYEINFCHEFYAHHKIDPISVYTKINEKTQAPFSALAKFNDIHILSASPERYLKKMSNYLMSEPIKGTIARGKSLAEDEALRSKLAIDPKEISENVMIVDLVRNDFSKIASKGSVKVEELCGIYTFQTVHQMISRVSCMLEPKVNFTDILKATFPMGSMTGAPKIRAMELADNEEQTRRGIYSGTLGYIAPNGDFDFNVVIRTLLYNSNSQNLSCMVGSAITALSNPEKEYEETLLKARALLSVFE